MNYKLLKMNVTSKHFVLWIKKVIIKIVKNVEIYVTCQSNKK